MAKDDAVYTTIDLCAGIGGVRRGFELAGNFTNVLSAEIDEDACKTYATVFHEKVSDVKNDLTSSEFKNKAASLAFDVLLAGFPCQAFSSVGKKRGFEDTTKGTIFFHIKDIVDRCRIKPKAIFLENVANLLSHDKGRTINKVFEVLDKELNYQVVGLTGLKEQVLIDGVAEDRYVFDRGKFIRNTRDFGLPQNRPRVFIMAFSRDRFAGDKLDYLRDASTPTESKAQLKYSSLAKLLENEVEYLDDSLYLSQKYWDTLKKHKVQQRNSGRGFGYKIVYDFSKPELYTNAVSSTLLATGGSGKERNLVIQYKPGVAGKVHSSKRGNAKGEYGVLNSECVRIMTDYEWGRLQGFLGYGFLGGKKNRTECFPTVEHIGISRGQMYKQFGNSVSIPVIKSMADFMLEQLKKLDSI